jgi:multicomponent Na+:H+ antiporter subunit C
VKKLIGMNIFQWSIILFFVSTGAKHDGTLPILEASHGHQGAEAVIHASHYVNPLPHVLMLTAIVVGVATTGVALALLLRIYRTYHTLEEDEILDQMR